MRRSTKTLSNTVAATSDSFEYYTCNLEVKECISLEYVENLHMKMTWCLSNEDKEK